MLIDLAKYLTVALILFLIGISGIILNRKNIIVFEWTLTSQ
jgi:NADH:ubiquinone oxidoreductase subunit K